MLEHGRHGAVEWAVADCPLSGEAVSGDRWIAAETRGSTLLGVIDGVGHGPEAWEAATRATKVIEAHPAEHLDTLLAMCHRALAETRGAAMTLALMEPEAGLLRWLGVGNVTGALVRPSTSETTSTGSSSLPAATGSVVVAEALLRGGIVGYQLPNLRVPEPVPIQPSDLVVLATDGILEDFAHGLDPERSVDMIATGILSRHSRGTDDALVLVGRREGSAG